MKNARYTDTEWEKFITILKQVVSVLKEHKEYLNYQHRSFRNGDKINLENLADLAGNHLFDDMPHLFEITKNDGHWIREYFQMNNYAAGEETRARILEEIGSYIEHGTLESES
jgi:hypothetical protein